ncbi:MAG: HNH endonuclease [Culicoidibacterales bacterium]
MTKYDNTNKGLTQSQWQSYLQNHIKADHLTILINIYRFRDHKCSQTEYHQRHDYKPNISLHKYLAKDLIIKFPESKKDIADYREDGTTRYWSVCFWAYKQGKYYIWELRQELINALEITFDITPENTEKPDKYLEGKIRTRISKQYERSELARNSFKQITRPCCEICNTSTIIGSIDIGEVHHKIKISSRAKSGEYDLNIKEDLALLCPSCHVLIHKLEHKMTNIQYLSDFTLVKNYRATTF